MYSAHAKHRVTTAIAGLLIAGSGLLAAATSSAADSQPAAGTGSGTSTTSASAPAAAPGTTASPAKLPAQAAAEPRGRVISRLPLSIRERATSDSRYLGAFPSGAVISLHCKVVGQKVEGNNLWYQLGNGHPGYVAARYVQNLSAVPYCRA
jgi:hypothetical protein